MANKISVIIDVAVDKGVTSLKKFRSAIGEADTASGKMRAGFDVAKESIVANAANIAMAAGGALVAFGIKSVKAFQDTALAAGQFSDATGTSVEAASRFIEVAGDFGIEAGAVQGAMQKMNKAIGDGKPVMDEFGDSIVRAKDGTVDSAATFQNLVTKIGAIKDPTERAKAAQEAFGKSYGDIARFMEMSATDLAAALGNVSDAKVIDPAELEKARKFQASMDNLKDKLEDVTLAVGEQVVPALSAMADGFTAVSEAIQATPLDELAGFFSSGSGGWGLIQGAIDKFKESWNNVFGDGGEVDKSITTVGYGTEAAKSMAAMYAERLVPSADAAKDSFERVDRSAQDFTDEIRRAEDATRNLDDTYSALIDKLDQQDAWDSFFEKMYVFHSETGRSAQETRDYTRDLAEMIKKLEGVPPETKTKMLATLDEGNIAAIESRLAQLGRNRVVSISGQLVGGGLRNQMEGRAAGGPITAGTPYLVGERGPEIVVPGRSGTVIPNGAIGGGINVAIYPRALPTDRELIDLVTNLRRRNGGVI